MLLDYHNCLKNVQSGSFPTEVKCIQIHDSIAVCHTASPPLPLLLGKQAENYGIL